NRNGWKHSDHKRDETDDKFRHNHLLSLVAESTALAGSANDLCTNSIPVSMMSITVPIVTVAIRAVSVSAIATLLKRGIGPAHRFAVTITARWCVWSKIGKALCE